MKNYEETDERQEFREYMRAMQAAIQSKDDDYFTTDDIAAAPENAKRWLANQDRMTAWAIVNQGMPNNSYALIWMMELVDADIIQPPEGEVMDLAEWKLVPTTDEGDWVQSYTIERGKSKLHWIVRNGYVVGWGVAKVTRGRPPARTVKIQPTVSLACTAALARHGNYQAIPDLAVAKQWMECLRWIEPEDLLHIIGQISARKGRQVY